MVIEDWTPGMSAAAWELTDAFWLAADTTDYTQETHTWDFYGAALELQYIEQNLIFRGCCGLTIELSNETFLCLLKESYDCSQHS